MDVVHLVRQRIPGHRMMLGNSGPRLPVDATFAIQNHQLAAKVEYTESSAVGCGYCLATSRRTHDAHMLAVMQVHPTQHPILSLSQNEIIRCGLHDSLWASHNDESLIHVRIISYRACEGLLRAVGVILATTTAAQCLQNLLAARSRGFAQHGGQFQHFIARGNGLQVGSALGFHTNDQPLLCCEATCGFCFNPALAGNIGRGRSHHVGGVQHMDRAIFFFLGLQGIRTIALPVALIAPLLHAIIDNQAQNDRATDATCPNEDEEKGEEAVNKSLKALGDICTVVVVEESYQQQKCGNAEVFQGFHSEALIPLHGLPNKLLDFSCECYIYDEESYLHAIVKNMCSNYRKKNPVSPEKQQLDLSSGVNSLTPFTSVADTTFLFTAHSPVSPKEIVATFDLYVYGAASLLSYKDPIRDWSEVRNQPGARNKVVGLSQPARRRFLQKTMQIDMRQPAYTFLLTYPDVFPEDPVQWSKHREAFKQRLVRELGQVERTKQGRKKYIPTFSAIWRTEITLRKTGKMEGHPAPHTHVVLYPNLPEQMSSADELEEWRHNFEQWQVQAWCEVIGSDKERQRADKTIKVETKEYFLDYIAKWDVIDVRRFFPQGTGRMWGFWYEENLPISEKLTIQLTADQAAAIERLMKEQIWEKARDDIKLQTLRCFWNVEFINSLSAILGYSLVEEITS